MQRLTFEINTATKRKFMALLAAEGRTVKDVLEDYVYVCTEFGIVDTGELVAEVNRLKMKTGEIDGEA